MNGIEQDLQGRAKVVRLDLMSALGREIAARYKVRAIPTVVVVDGDSNVVYRHSGVPNRREVVARATAA